MRINIPVGCIVLIKEKFSYKKAIQDVELLFNFALSKLDKTEYTSCGLTDIDDEGNFCIVQLTSNGIKRIKYEEFQDQKKCIEVYAVDVVHSKEKLYTFLERIQETRHTRKEKFKLYFRYLLFRAFRNIDVPPTLVSGQLPGYVWDTITGCYPFWKEHTPQGLKNLLSLNGKLLFKGNSKELK